jgi:hypothetical protein
MIGFSPRTGFKLVDAIGGSIGHFVAHIHSHC